MHITGLYKTNGMVSADVSGFTLTRFLGSLHDSIILENGYEVSPFAYNVAHGI